MSFAWSIGFRERFPGSIPILSWKHDVWSCEIFRQSRIQGKVLQQARVFYRIYDALVHHPSQIRVNLKTFVCAYCVSTCFWISRSSQSKPSKDMFQETHRVSGVAAHVWIPALKRQKSLELILGAHCPGERQALRDLVSITADMGMVPLSWS